tara:strand:+ start:543 stop:776 length:234 start_codon:yes stop_codon:yes gene_type:complete
MNILNILISVGMILGAFFVISGYKEDFTVMNLETKLNPQKIENPPNFKLKKDISKPKRDCNPGFDCRRVGLYCSLIG